MSMAIPPKAAERELGVMSAFQLSQDDCDKIINLHKDSQNPHKTGRIQTDNSNVVDIKTRDTDIWVIHENNQWVDALICTAAITANDQFQLNLSGLVERPQLLKYHAPSRGYDWHTDIGHGDHSTRKISISIILNDGYEGGDMGFFSTGETLITPDRGMAVCFPAFMPHRVTPVTKGIRWSLVCWVSGDPFR
jgi:PKHD-type hydroxylase